MLLGHNLYVHDVLRNAVAVALSNGDRGAWVNPLCKVCRGVGYTEQGSCYYCNNWWGEMLDLYCGLKRDPV